MERLMRISRLRHVGLARSAEGNAVLVRRHPLVERLQLRIQRARELDAAAVNWNMFPMSSAPGKPKLRKTSGGTSL